MYDAPATVPGMILPRREISLGKDRVAIVSLPDYLWLKEYTWHFDPRDNATAGYAVRYEYFRDENGKKKNRKFYMHRDITQPKSGLVVDHADGCGVHNFRENLRVCTQQQNRGNFSALSLSGYKGVSWNKGKWRARITFDGIEFELGTYTDAAVAARVYDVKALEVFGEFAWTNFPREEYDGSNSAAAHQAAAFEEAPPF